MPGVGGLKLRVTTRPDHMRMRFWSVVTLGVLMLLLALPVSAQSAPEDLLCGSVPSRYGPYDYTNQSHREQHLDVVERVHFTNSVKTLRKGATGSLAADIEYVLNWFPNHHQALDVLSKYAIREGNTRPGGAKHDLQCRFQWAAEVQPKDAMVRVIEGMYHYRKDNLEQAKKKLELASKIVPTNPEVHYNLGLAYYKLEDYQNARLHAKKAYAGGYPLPGLRNLLERAGHPLSK